MGREKREREHGLGRYVMSYEADVLIELKDVVGPKSLMTRL